MSIEPIFLNEFNETILTSLSENKPFDFGVERRMFCIGTHGQCGGAMDIVKISRTHCALICRECARIPGTEVPNASACNVGKLRHWFEQKLKADKGEVNWHRLTE